jgi:hypothetical protein
MTDHDMTNDTSHDVTSESHRAACTECAAVWADLERISAAAKALPLLTPSRDLWAGIESRLGGRIPAAAEVGQADADPIHRSTRAAGDTSASGRARHRWFTARTVRLATAASLLVAATAAVTWQFAAGRLADDVSMFAVPPAIASGDAAAGSGSDPDALLKQAAYAESYATMDVEIQSLQSLVDRRRADLDSSTVRVLERNLALIDQAIAESRAALAKDPASRFLATQLVRSYSSKLTFLRETATLPAGT